METATSETTCQDCFRPKAQPKFGAQGEVPESEPIQTQWQSICRCDCPYSPNAQFSLEVCANCRRRVAVHATEAVHRLDLCSCSNPDPKRLATSLKQGEADPVTLNLHSVGWSLDRFPEARFAPVAMLGNSPRAIVLLCRDRQRGTKVAVKCFKTISPALFSTFESEVRKNKQLTHTNIAKIIDAGIENGDTPYVVTEYKDGFNLEQCVALYGVPSYDVAVNILLGVCEALDYAQKQSVLHRDIRPGNIIFLDDLNSQPSVCLTDFALPKVKAAEELSDPWLALYLSGDEARNLDYSEKSEVYALGNIGYLLLTGQAPFSTGSALDIKNMHALKLPPRISSVKFDHSRPGDLDEVVEKCLEKDPNDRFESVGKLKERLEVFPRRVQMRIDAVLAERNRAKMMRIGLIGAVVAAACAVVYLVTAHH